MIALIRYGMLPAAFILSVAATAQDAEPVQADLNWTLDEYRTRCVPIWSEESLELVGVDGGCAVAEFGEIVTLDGFKFYYALYNDDKRFIPDNLFPDEDPEVWINSLRDGQWVTEFTALALFKEDTEIRERATMFHLRKQRNRPSGFTQVLTFAAPEIIQADIGLIMYLRGFGCCDGMSQYGFDEYWLWRDGDWIQLDPHSWFRSARERLRLPAEYSLHGILNRNNPSWA